MITTKDKTSRRKQKRLKTKYYPKIFIEIENSRYFSSAHLYNISFNGCCIRINQFLKVDENIKIHIMSFIFYGTVKHVVGNIAGIQLKESIPTKEMDKILEYK